MGQVCPYQHFCIYQNKNFAGTFVNYYYYCKTYNAIPNIFSGVGSWKNDQTPGVRTYLYGSTKNLIYTTAPAYFNNASYNWASVYYVVACQ